MNIQTEDHYKLGTITRKFILIELNNKEVRRIIEGIMADTREASVYGECEGVKMGVTIREVET